jgi:hypothetical protein
MQKIPKIPVKQFYSRYEPYLSPLAVMIGFVWDNLTLQRIDLLVENIVIVSYLTIALCCIIFLNAYDAGRLRGRYFDKMVVGVPFLLQIVFGGLFSAFLIFYTRSATIVASWPFLVMIFGLLVGNEVFRKRYQRFVFNISIYFIALFSYCVFAVPIILHSIGRDIFILSGVVSLFLITLVIYLVYIIIPGRVKYSRNLLVGSIGGIFLAFNAMYFLNLIPPIPLALKESGVYHQVIRENGDYRVAYEPAPWYRFWAEWDDTFHWQEGEPVYNFTAVFAPTDFSVNIKHRWSYYNEQQEEWVVKDILSYSMIGGREGGYRGYSLKYAVQPGSWRVDTITETGQILGRNEFKIVSSGSQSDLKIDNK